ncbi:hypothetical protein V8C26DRAFT_389421 [Trichoderma gracile]
MVSGMATVLGMLLRCVSALSLGYPNNLHMHCPFPGVVFLSSALSLRFVDQSALERRWEKRRLTPLDSTRTRQIPLTF